MADRQPTRWRASAPLYRWRRGQDGPLIGREVDVVGSERTDDADQGVGDLALRPLRCRV